MLYIIWNNERELGKSVVDGRWGERDDPSLRRWSWSDTELWRMWDQFPTANNTQDLVRKSERSLHSWVTMRECSSEVSSWGVGWEKENKVRNSGQGTQRPREMECIPSQAWFPKAERHPKCLNGPSLRATSWLLMTVKVLMPVHSFFTCLVCQHTFCNILWHLWLTILTVTQVPCSKHHSHASILFFSVLFCAYNFTPNTNYDQGVSCTFLYSTCYHSSTMTVCREPVSLADKRLGWWKLFREGSG